MFLTYWMFVKSPTLVGSENTSEKDDGVYCLQACYALSEISTYINIKLKSQKVRKVKNMKYKYILYFIFFTSGQQAPRINPKLCSFDRFRNSQ